MTPTEQLQHNEQQFYQDSLLYFINRFKRHDAVIMTAPSEQSELFSGLFAKNYAINRLDGSYLNDNIASCFLVINRHDDPDFIANLTILAHHFDQSHIFVIKSGDTPSAYLLNTSDLPFDTLPITAINEWIGNPAFFVPLRNRPIYHSDSDPDLSDHNVSHLYQLAQIDNGYPQNVMGRMACKSMGKKFLDSIGIICD